jgi:hypothetical protein
MQRHDLAVACRRESRPRKRRAREPACPREESVRQEPSTAPEVSLLPRFVDLPLAQRDSYTPSVALISFCSIERSLFCIPTISPCRSCSHIGYCSGRGE